MLSNRQLFFSNLAHTSEYPIALEIEKAEGCWLFSPGGKKYFDLIAGVSVSNIGHNNPMVIKAVKEQLEKHMHLMVYGEFIQKPQVSLAELVCRYLPGNLNSLFFTTSGSEAVEGAIKLARRYTGRYEIISFKNAYHGSTMGALSVMGDESLKRSFRPLIPSVKQINYNCTGSLEEISTDTACVIIEPVQGEAGVVLPAKDFLNKVRKKCTENGTLLVFDEIQTGFGRTGMLFAMNSLNVIPDVALFAKGLGGGMPLGAFVSSREIMGSLCNNPALGHITTFGGHPVSCSAGQSSLEYIINNGITSGVEQKGDYFRKLLDHPSITEVRGMGLLLAMELEDAVIAKKVIAKSLEKGLITDWFLFNEKCIRISPPLIITEEEIEFACRILLESLDEI